jgi:putative membrane protein
MTSRNTTVILAAVASLFVGSAVFSQQSQRDQSNQSPGAADQSNQAGAAAQGGQDAQANEQQIEQVIDQIAQDPKTAADKTFLLTTVLNNRAEVELAKQVKEKTQNPQVKKLAQQIVDQLQKENQELTKTAQALGLTIPSGLHKAQVQEVQIVATLPADQLDKQYTAHVQADNAADASTYQSEAQIAQDQQVRQIAQRQLQAQQQRAQDWNQSAQAMGMPGSAEAQPAGATIRGGESR